MNRHYLGVAAAMIVLGLGFFFEPEGRVASE